MERIPQGEQLPAPEALLVEANAIIQAEPDPSARALLYATTLLTGNPEHALNGKAVRNLVNLLPAAPLTSAERQFDPGFGKNGLRLYQIADGVGVVHGPDQDMTGLAGSLSKCAEVLYGRHSTVHDAVVVSLLRGGVPGEDGALLRHYTSEEMVALGDSASVGGVGDFLLALVQGHGVDVMDEKTPYRYIHDQVWERGGIDSGKEDSYTYNLARAYIDTNNISRARELFNLLRTPKLQLPIALAVAAASENSPGARHNMEIAARNILREHSDDLVGAELEMAAYFARIGKMGDARERLLKDDGPERLQAGVWADIYTRTGNGDARMLAVKYWKQDFIGREDQVAHIFGLAGKDMELGRTDPTSETSTTPLIAWEIMHAKGDRLEEWRPKLLGRLAGYFAEVGNADALTDMLAALRTPGTPNLNRVRGFTAAAIALQGRQRVSSL